MSERMVKQFMEMVCMASESGEEAEFIDYLQREFLTLGGSAEKDGYGNLVARFAARNCSGAEPILLSCHADTVKPGKGIKPRLEEGVIRSSGDTILGADDKAGIAEMLEALRRATSMPPVEIAISRQEEVGLLGVKNLDFNLLSARRGFLLDNDTLETIVIGGPSYFAIDANFKGRSAHAGMDPEKGINAIQAASRAIAGMRLGRVDPETTANVGVISGGLIRNGVPDSASFLAECRSLNHEKAEALAAEMEQIARRAAESAGAQIDIRVNNVCRAVHIPADAWTVRIAKQALAMVGVHATTTLITGFTDASIYNNHGIEMAVVGIGGRDEHSTSEHIYVADMEKAVRMLLEVMRLSA